TLAPFGDAYEKIGTIQRRLAWPLHKDDTLFQSGRPMGLNIYFVFQLFTTVCVHRLQNLLPTCTPNEFLAILFRSASNTVRSNF
ncbi:hypothetical protein BJV77DRAFT_1123881, partial [Russula vinacea]